MLTIQSSTLIVYPKPFVLSICSILALVRDLESFDTLKYVNHKTQTNVTKPKRVSQTQNGITKHKTESHNLKQNHKTLNRITKHKPESQNPKENHKPKTELQSQNRITKPKTENPESGKIFFLESGILGFGIQNTDKRIQNPITIGLRNPISS